MSETEFQEDPRPFRQRGFVASAAVLAVLVVLGVVITVVTLVDDDSPAAREPGSPSFSAEPSETSTDPDASRCGLPGLEKSGTLSAPPKNVTWELVGTVALPSTEEAGPGEVEDSGLRYCYAHTPEGALLMAANTFAWDEADPAAVVANSIASGPGKAAAEAALEDGTAGGSDTGSDQLLQIRGFRLLAYNGSSAMVDIVVQASPGQFVSLALELVWEGGDWRLRLSPDGSLFNGKAVPDLTGYIPWAGA